MNIMNAIRKAKADGLFLVLTADGAKGFAGPDQCEEYVATLAGGEFAVVRFLWDGGEEKIRSREDFVSRRHERDRAVMAATIAAFERADQERAARQRAEQERISQQRERLPHPLDRRDEQDPNAGVK